MRERRTIALTGATGFLGSSLLRALLAEGHCVVVIKRTCSKLERIRDVMTQVEYLDIDLEPVETLFDRHPIDTIIHCATDYGRKATDPYAVIEANMVLPLRLLHFAKEAGCRHFINTDTILDKRISYYSLSKNQFAQWLKAYADSMTCVNVALEHFYGPGDDQTKFVAHVIRAFLDGEPELKLTPGEQVRYFIYIDDVVRAFLAILDHFESWTSGYFPFQVGTQKPVSIRNFVQLVQKLTGASSTHLAFGAIPYRENEVMDPSIDIGPLMRLGWQPRIDLETGIAQTIAAERRIQLCVS